MMIHGTSIPDVKVIEFRTVVDQRGHFARTFCAREFMRHGMNSAIAQENLSFSHLRGTIRGMHFQIPPKAEAKLIRCTRGAIIDIVVDLRPESATFLRHFALELTQENHRALYIPERFANGYQALTDAAEATYLTTAFYEPEHERGLRFNDPLLGLPWPVPATAVSEKDRSWAPLDDSQLSIIRRELQM